MTIIQLVALKECHLKQCLDSEREYKATLINFPLNLFHCESCVEKQLYFLNETQLINCASYVVHYDQILCKILS